MRRSRENDEFQKDSHSNNNQDDDGNNNNASNKTEEEYSPIPHPSKHFVPYTGRYYLHFIAKNLKNATGHNMRLLLHSNGLCVLSLDPSHILVVSYFNLKKSLASSTSESNDNRKMIDRLSFCDSFPLSTTTTTSTTITTTCKGATSDDQKLVCNNADDLYSLVVQGKVAVCATSICHQINGTRGQKDRLVATKGVTGRNKRHAVYCQDEMSVCTFPCETLAKCPSCGKWQVIRQTLQIHGSSANDGDNKSTTDNNNGDRAQQLPSVPVPLQYQNTEGCVMTLPYVPPREQFQHGTSKNVEGVMIDKKLRPFFLPKSIKVPITVNSVLVEVNPVVAETGNNNFELALSEPIGRGFLAVVQPKADVSFVKKFERASLTSPMVGPENEKVRIFVADSFTGTTNV